MNLSEDNLSQFIETYRNLINYVFACCLDMDVYRINSTLKLREIEVIKLFKIRSFYKNCKLFANNCNLILAC